MATLTVAVLTAAPASALPITRLLTVRVVTVCDDFGANCASQGPAGNPFFERETDKIWAQAGIDVDFLRFTTIHSTLFSHLDESIPGRRLFDLAPPSLTSVDMFLVRSITGRFGEAWLGFGGLAIDMDTVMGFNLGIGRLDTIAHELGHNLGLGHDNTDPFFLMSVAGRHSPSSLGQICPDGPCFDLLAPGHIARARTSPFLRSSLPPPTPIPEPATLLLFGTTAAGLGLARWRHRRKRRAA